MAGAAHGRGCSLGEGIHVPACDIRVLRPTPVESHNFPESLKCSVVHIGRGVGQISQECCPKWVRIVLYAAIGCLKFFVVVARLKAIPEYRSLFAKAFGSTNSITADNLAKALKRSVLRFSSQRPKFFGEHSLFIDQIPVRCFHQIAVKVRSALGRQGVIAIP